MPKFRSTLNVLKFSAQLFTFTQHFLLQSGIDQLFNQLVRPRLRTMISDIYKDVSYVLDEESYSTSEYHDVVRKRFVKYWEETFDSFRVRLWSLAGSMLILS